MTPDPLEVRLDVYVDGRLVQTVALDAAGFARLGAPGDRPQPGPDWPPLIWAVDLPAGGRYHLAVDLRRAPPAEPGPPEAGLPALSPNDRWRQPCPTVHWQPLPPDRGAAPPDEPHVTG